MKKTIEYKQYLDIAKKNWGNTEESICLKEVIEDRLKYAYENQV